MKIASQLDLFTSPDFRAYIQQCIHCGLCLQACPTYIHLGTEMDSPRGRIAMIKAVLDGRIEFGGAFNNHFQLCLACRSCESACPSGIHYGLIIEIARTAMEASRHPGILERLIRWIVLRQLMPYINRLKIIARILRFYQLIGLSYLVRRLNFLRGRLKVAEGLLPDIPSHYSDYSHPLPAFGVKHGKVAFFHGCIQEAFLAPVNEATIRVLQINGYEVHIPKHQTCCGAAQLHLGEVELARQLARQNIDAFFQASDGSDTFDAIINNAGGCGASLKEYDQLLKDDPQYAEKAKQFTIRVKDISEFLIDHLHVPPLGEVKQKITYSDSCHLRHAQKIVSQPRNLLSIIPGIELVELKNPELCCGSAGVYNLINAEVANSILNNKITDIANTGANVVVTTNVGCYLQLLYGVRQAHIQVKVVHLIELIDLSYRNVQT